MKSPPQLTHNLILASSAAIIFLIAWTAIPTLRAQIKTTLSVFISPQTVQDIRIKCSENLPNKTGFQSEQEHYEAIWGEAMIFLKNLAVAMTYNRSFLPKS